MRRIEALEKAPAPTPLYRLFTDEDGNDVWIKRDDLLPFSFGGNKVRKAAEFYREIWERTPDVVMTYGSRASNHCRVIANMAAAMGLPCHIISPEADETEEEPYNAALVRQFGASVETAPLERIAETIAARQAAYQREGKRPFFIQGGGHGNAGTRGYVRAYGEILRQSEAQEISFDYLFHASGTGTTQAGLICGKLLDEVREAPETVRNETIEKQTPVRRPGGAGIARIVGISIARENPRGRDVIRESIRDYLGERFPALFREEALEFTDAWRMGGYGEYTAAVKEEISNIMKSCGIPMDTTYVGKAFYGMRQYLRTQKLHGQRVLFLHTGGTPIYFDRAKE